MAQNRSPLAPLLFSLTIGLLLVSTAATSDTPTQGEYWPAYVFQWPENGFQITEYEGSRISAQEEYVVVPYDNVNNTGSS